MAQTLGSVAIGSRSQKRHALSGYRTKTAKNIMRTCLWACTKAHKNAGAPLEIHGHPRLTTLVLYQKTGGLDFLVAETFAKACENTVHIRRQAPHGRMGNQKSPIGPQAEACGDLEQLFVNFRHLVYLDRSTNKGRSVVDRLAL